MPITDFSDQVNSFLCHAHPVNEKSIELTSGKNVAAGNMVLRRVLQVN